MESVEVLQAANASLGEGPIWDQQDGAFYWGDLKQHKIYRFDPEVGQTGVWPLPYQFGCLAIRERGGICVVTDNGYEHLDLVTGELTKIVNPEEGTQFDHCYNDGKVDSYGRFWVGSLPMAGARNQEITENTGRLYSLSPDGAVRDHRGGLYVTNGMAWNPEDNVMYHVDSWIRTIFSYDFDGKSGTISEPRTFFSFEAETDGFPDGMTVDQDGNLWVAMWDGWKLVCLSPEGNRLGEIHLPVQKPTSCCFGGEGLDTLFITSASCYLSSADLEAGPLAGAILKTNPGVRGFASNRFKG